VTPAAWQGKRSDRGLWLIALAVAALQIALAWRSAALDGGRNLVADFALTVTIAWGAALAVLLQERPRHRRSDRIPQLVGMAAVAASLVVLAAWPVYGAIDRLLPLLGGGGLCLMAFGWGVRAWPRKAYLLLGLPLLNPLPKFLQHLLDPTRSTATCAMLIRRLMGSPTTLDGDTLVMADGTLHVLPACSGLLGMSRLWVLATLIGALFSTSAQKNVWLFLSSALIGFLLNAIRIAILAGAVARGDDDAFQYWHVGPGASWFSLGSVMAAGLAWWWIVRSDGVRARAAGVLVG
jgi:cyanoexosortase A